MAKLHHVTHRFVERVPSPLEDGVIYVSIPFGTVIHKCCCGCGDKVVTPLTPVDWSVIFDGQSVSLYPSIGRWDATCRSHYWIDHNRVIWAENWSRAQIQAGKAAEARTRVVFSDKIPVNVEPPLAAPTPTPTTINPATAPSQESWWHRLWKHLFGS
jgi:hypothetical protein